MEMKEYMAPEMEVIEMKRVNVLLQTSQNEGPGILPEPGSDDPDDAG